jgi:tetratricopeptide (TPR) repeat protein
VIDLSRDADRQQLLLLAEVDPKRALAAARTALEHALADGDRTAEVHARRALGVAERVAGRPRAGLDVLDHALERAGDDARLGGLVRLSRAACFLGVGDIDGGLDDLQRALAVLDGVDHAIALYQRASVLIRLSDDPDAAHDLDEAIRLLTAGRAGMYEAHARTNRGLMRTYAGLFGPAREDLERARELYLRLGIAWAAAGALTNLAFLDNRSGDVIGALDRFEQAREEFVAHGLDIGMLDLDCCDALLAAGLPGEALERAVAAVAELQRDGNEFEVPEAQLVAAVASERAGRPEGAIRWAGEAAERFRSLGRIGWADMAELVRLRSMAPRPAALRSVRAAARRLERSGLLLGALQAHLLAAQLALRLGRLDDAASELARLTRRRLPPDLRLGVCDANARLAEMRGDSPASSRWVRRGVRELDRYQRSFASAEVRWAVTVHAKGVLEVGRHRALQSGRASHVFKAVELARTNAMRRAPLARPDDDTISRLLGELRHVSQALRECEDPVAARQLLAQQVRVQRQISERERAGRSASAATDESTNVVTVADVRDTLAGRRLVQFDAIDNRLVGVSIDGARPVLHDLGPTAGLAALYDAAGRALSRLARSDLGFRSREAAIQRLTDVVGQIDATLSRCWPGDEELVLAPPAELYAAPWSLLPSLAGRPFTVAASATVWQRAERTASPETHRTVLVAGTDLAQARAEVRDIARLYDDVTTLWPSRATAARVTQAIAPSRIAHFATHHHHRRENPLFGSMDLADGPLYLHDLLRVDRLPYIVVLSACEAAKGDVSAMGDVLGASTVLMERGTATVVANASLVADTDTNRVAMVELHRHLADRTTAARALLSVRRRAADLGPREAALAAGFTCFGAG